MAYMLPGQGDFNPPEEYPWDEIEEGEPPRREPVPVEDDDPDSPF